MSDRKIANQYRIAIWETIATNWTSHTDDSLLWSAWADMVIRCLKADESIDMRSDILINMSSDITSIHSLETVLNVIVNMNALSIEGNKDFICRVMHTMFRNKKRQQMDEYMCPKTNNRINFAMLFTRISNIIITFVNCQPRGHYHNKIIHINDQRMERGRRNTSGD
eukprot:715381_1